MIDKINVFNFSEKVKPFIYKFIGGLTNTDIDIVKEDYNYLISEGIIIKLPSQMKLCSYSILVLKKRVEFYKIQNNIQKIINNPLILINNVEINNNNKSLMDLTNDLKKCIEILNIDFNKYMLLLSDKLKRLYENEYLNKHSEYDLLMEVLVGNNKYPDEALNEVDKAIKDTLGDN
jgi:hypothetical protein